MENNNNSWYSYSDPAILVQLGIFLQQTRLQQNRTQQEVAKAAGINRSTLVQIEGGGGGTLLSFIQILRALQQLQLLQNFEVKTSISPLQLAKLDQQKRKRAGRKNTDTDTQQKSDW